MSGAEPETVRQALRQDATREHAATVAALCARCSSFVGWGAQNGFDSLPAPCEVCVIIMEIFPNDRGNGWRTPYGALSERSTWGSAIREGTRGGEVSVTPVAGRRSRRKAERGAAKRARAQADFEQKRAEVVDALAVVIAGAMLTEAKKRGLAADDSDKGES